VHIFVDISNIEIGAARNLDISRLTELVSGNREIVRKVCKSFRDDLYCLLEIERSLDNFTLKTPSCSY
jgi:hypothetical protein